MEKSIHFTGGLQDLIFGRWMPVHLYHQYESGEHPLTERMWDLPDSPAEYIKLDKSLLNRWRDAVDSSEYFKTWTPPFYRLSPGLEAPFHPVCRFYDHVIWCECRMIIQAALKMQEILPMTQLKYELVTLQQELSGLLQECHRRVENTGPESTGIGDKLSHYLHKLAKNSILILLLEVNERFNHLLDKRGLSLDQIFIKYLREPVPGRKPWFITISRIKFLISKVYGTAEFEPFVIELLFKVRNEKKLQTSSGKKYLQVSEQFLENIVVCYVAMSENNDMKPAADINDPDNCRNLITEWQKLLITSELNVSDDQAERVKQIFQTLLLNLPKVRQTLNMETEERSEAAGLISMIEDLFMEELSVPQPGLNIHAKQNDEVSKGHWLLNQYISLKEIENKLEITPRTMRTYISKHQLPVSEVSQKSKWIRSEDFEMFMEKLKKKK